ncbi:MAG: LysR family transcriptional regulator [Opitutales bacterium]|nr:LysR family transcriptional regulator [Opitutales bacterium]
MKALNFHHLRYFHAVAECGSLTTAAATLRVAQSAVSVQIKQLEASLGVLLFEREHKTLKLTEEGRIVLEYARAIFQTGGELLATLHNRSSLFSKKLHVGAVATLSRNFQLRFLRSMIEAMDVEVIIRSGGLGELLTALEAHRLDLVLTNTPVRAAPGSSLRAHLVDKQSVSLIRHPAWPAKRKFRFPSDLVDVPLILPATGNEIRQSFDVIVESAGIPLLIAAEADDMAMLRLLARETRGMALLPTVVVADELAAGTLAEVCPVPHLFEHFYAITCRRRHPNPLLLQLLHG